MSIRSMIFALAVGCLAAGCFDEEGSAEDSSGTVTEYSSSKWQCKNVTSGCNCLGYVALLPIEINVKNVRVLNNNEINVLSNDLNKLSVLDGGVLNNDKILNDVEVTVLQDFLNKFKINVTKNDIDVCTTVLGVLLCK